MLRRCPLLDRPGRAGPAGFRSSPLSWLLLAALATAACGEEVPLLYPDAPDHVRAGQRCGACLTTSGPGADQFGSAGSLQSLQAMAAAGLKQVSLTARGQQAEAVSTGPITTPVDAAAEGLDLMRADAARARTLGLQVMIKPHLTVKDGTWRGEIAPAASAGGWGQWFASYEAFLLTYARLAREVGADWLCVGLELKSATRTEGQRWRSLIARVRQEFPGKLTYGANWDEAEQVTFWDALDAIGVQMFAPLAGGDSPDQGSLDRGANGWLVRFHELAGRQQRPLLLTEVGFVNRPGTAEDPWTWPEQLAPAQATEEGDRAQARALLAIVHTFGQSPLVEGFYIWRWFTDPTYAKPGNISFALRPPALAVLRGACVLGNGT